MSPMKTSLRLPDGIADEATAYANGLGISLNALCAVALRDYLDRRTASPKAEPTPQTPTRTVTQAVAPVVPVVEPAKALGLSSPVRQAAGGQ